MAELIASFPPDEPIVSMVEFKGRILVATSQRIFEVKGDVLVPLLFQKVVDDPDMLLATSQKLEKKDG